MNPIRERYKFPIFSFRILRRIRFRHVALILIVLLTLSNITAWGTARWYGHLYRIQGEEYHKVKGNLQETEKQLQGAINFIDSRNAPNLKDSFVDYCEKNGIKSEDLR